MVPVLNIIRTTDGLGFKLPSYTSKHHCGLNLLAGIPNTLKLNPGDRVLVPVGFAIAVPDGLCGQIVSLPTLAHKSGIIVLDSPSILNPADHEPIFVLLQNTGRHQYILKRGTPIAQLIFTPVLQVTWKEITPKKRSTRRPTQPIVEQTAETPIEVEVQPNPKTPEKREKKSIRDRFKTSE